MSPPASLTLTATCSSLVSFTPTLGCPTKAQFSRINVGAPQPPRWSSVELPTAGGDRGLVQQGAVQGEGRFPARHHAEEDPLSHLAVPQGQYIELAEDFYSRFLRCLFQYQVFFCYPKSFFHFLNTFN